MRRRQANKRLSALSRRESMFVRNPLVNTGVLILSTAQGILLQLKLGNPQITPRLPKKTKPVKI